MTAITTALQWIRSVAPARRPTVSDPLSIVVLLRRYSRGVSTAGESVVRGSGVMSRWDELRVDGARRWSRLVELGEIGAIKGPNGEQGCARLALTDVDREGRDLVVGWMQDLGLGVKIDAIGNVVAIRPGTDPNAAPVMTG